MKKEIKCVIGLLCLAFVLTAFKDYRGIPIDSFRSRVMSNISPSDFTVVNGIEIEGNQYRSTVDDAYIIFKNNDHNRTLLIDVSTIETNSDILMCTVWLGTEMDGFWDMNIISKELHLGINKFVIPYDGKYSDIRIDFGEQAGELVTVDSICIVNRFSDWQNYIKNAILMAAILIAIYAIMLFLMKYRDKIENLDTSLWDFLICPFRKLFADIYLFCIRNRRALKCLIVFSIVLYGGFAFNYTLSIDEENNQMNPNEYLLYISGGRFFLGILIKLFGNSPFFNAIVGGVMMYIAAVMLIALLDRYKTCTQFSCFVFCGLFMSMPYVIGETMNFVMQGMHTALGYILVALALNLLSYLNWGQNKRKELSLLFWGLFFLVLSVGIYQSFVVVYIFLVAGITMLQLQSEDKISKTVRFVLKNILFLFIILSCYEIIVFFCHKFIVSDSGYLGGFIGWNKMRSNQWIWQNTVSNFLKVIKGEYYNQTGGNIVKISIIFYTIYVIVAILKQKKEKKILMLFIAGSLIIIPFAIPLCLGSFYMLGRSLNALPIFLGFIWFLILNEIDKYKLLGAAVETIALLLLIFQTKYYNEFVYADQLRYQKDVIMAGSIMEEIEKKIEDPNKPLVFVGTYFVDYSGNLSNVNGCESFFAFGNGDNLRILNFLNLSGYKVMYPNADQINDAIQCAAQFPKWPREGCIQDRGDYILIKLGNN